MIEHEIVGDDMQAVILSMGSGDVDRMVEMLAEDASWPMPPLAA